MITQNTIANNWIKTDDMQFLKPITDTIFEIMNVNQTPTKDAKYEVAKSFVYMDDYTTEELVAYLEPYGYTSLKDLKSFYKNAYIQILAEIISESEHNESECLYFKTIADVNSWLQKIDTNLSI